METVTLKMEGKLLQDMEKSIKNCRYSTRTEFIREAIRDKLSELEKEEAIRKLTLLKGSMKGRMSDEEAGELALRKLAKKKNISLY